MLYAKYQEPSFEEKFAGYLESIVSLIRSRIGDNLVSIVLIGGYGRGEGSIRLQGNSASPVNDIDLVVVSHKQIDKDMLKQLSIDCARIVKPDSQYVHDRYCPLDFHVDIFNLKTKDLSKYVPSQFNYDLKYASKIIYGEEVFSRIPAFNNQEVPLQDGLVLLFNRCLSLTEVFSSALISQCQDLNQTDWIYYVAIKGILDSAAALLILWKKYVPFQKERIENLKSMRDKYSFLQAEPDILGIFKEYAQRGLVIKDADLNSPLKHWCLARKILLKTLDYYLAQVYSIPSPDSLGEKTKIFIAHREEKRQPIKWYIRWYKATAYQILRFFLHLLKYIIKQILYSLRLRKKPAIQPDIGYIWVAGSLLLKALNIQQAEAEAQNQRITLDVNPEDLNQVQNYLNLALSGNESIDFMNQNDNESHKWFLFRNKLVDVWKEYNWG